MKYSEKFYTLKDTLTDEQLQKIDFNKMDQIAQNKATKIIILLMFSLFLPITVPCYLFLGIHKIFQFICSIVLDKLPFMQENYWRFFFLIKSLEKEIKLKT